MTTSLSFLAILFIICIGLFVLGLVVLYIIDITQTQDTIRRNYPVLGRFRGFFSFLGEFFRQYFFAMDREEMPFNRAERDWVYHSSNGQTCLELNGGIQLVNLGAMGLVVTRGQVEPARDHLIGDLWA